MILILLAILIGIVYTIVKLIDIRDSLGQDRIILLLEVQGPHKIVATGKRICKPR